MKLKNALILFFAAIIAILSLSHYYSYLNYRSLFLTHIAQRVDAAEINIAAVMEEQLSANAEYGIQRVLDKAVASRLFIKSISFSKDGKTISHSSDRTQKDSPAPSDFTSIDSSISDNIHNGVFKFAFVIGYFEGDKKIRGRLFIELDSQYISAQITQKATEATRAIFIVQLVVVGILAVLFFVLGVKPLYKMIHLAQNGSGAKENFWVEDINELYKTMRNSFEELKNQKIEISTERNRLDTLLKTIPDLIWFKDTEGTYLFCNPTFGRFFGAKESEIMGKSDYDFVDTTLADFFRQKDKEAIAKGSPSLNEEWITFADDGKRALLETIKTPVYGQEGQVMGVLGIAHDITAIWKANEQVRELNKSLATQVEEETNKRLLAEQAMFSRTKMVLMGEVMGMVAHHWRQPLNALGITIQDLSVAYKMGELDEQYIKNTVDDSMRHIQNMSKTIDDFRNFFAPNKTKQDFCIEDAITSMLNIAAPSLEEYGITVDLKLDKRHTIEGFESEFKQVILNLLSNAKDAIIEHASQNKTIDMIVQDKGDFISIIMEDSGGGIPKEILDRVFDPYFSTKEQGKGSGIGLYMSRQLIERHIGGTITASNGANGARFEIRLKVS